MVYTNGLLGSGTDQGRNPVLQVTDAIGYQRDRRTYLNSTIRLRENLPFANGFFEYGCAALAKFYQFNKQLYTLWTTYNYDAATGQYDPQVNAPTVPGLLEG